MELYEAIPMPDGDPIEHLKITVNFKNGKQVKYNHDKVYSLLKSNLEKLNCFKKYKSYTATNNIPVALRGKELL